MAEKIDIYRSYGQKLISLFVRLLFSGERYSLTELSRMLNCSKQTVLRLLDDITSAYNVDVEELMEGNRKYVSIRRPRRPLPPTPLTEMELNILQMCRDFTAHLLGKQLFDEATSALLKSQVLLDKDKKVSHQHFGTFRSGMIDYSPYSTIICDLIEAMESKKTCKAKYKAIMENRAKTFYINPLKIFSHRDTIYLHAQIAPTPGKPFQEPDFDPLLAVHRFKDLEITDRQFKFPAKYDFEKTFNRNFGIMKDEVFEVEIEFTGWAAKYVAERIWSPDQKIIKIGQNKMRLIFTASSETEVISWVLSFGEQAKLIRPDGLVKEIARKVEEMFIAYK